METTSTHQTTLGEAPSQQQQDKDRCPGCDDHSVVWSETLLSDVLDDTITSDLSSESVCGGRYCINDGCEWFKLDRDPTPDREGDRNGLDTDDTIRLNQQKWVSRFDDKVELNGHEAVYHAENRCPECDGDVKVYLRRVLLHEDDEHTETKEVYKPTREKCVNYGEAGSGCTFEKS